MLLRSLRLAHGFTQARLAAAMGVSRPYITQIESGRKPLPASRAVDVGRALGLAGDDLALVVGRLVVASEARP